MTAALWPHVTAALASVWGQATSWPVFDGQPHTYAQLPAGVCVGINPEMEQSSGGFTQEWRDAGPAGFAARLERGTVRCSIWSQTGDADAVPACRSAIFTTLDVLVDACSSITPLGVDSLTDLVPLTGGDVLQMLTADGTICELTFTVAYTGLVT